MADEPTKTCPYCAEVILAAAIVCRHCRSRLDDHGGAAQRSAPASEVPTGSAGDARPWRPSATDGAAHGSAGRFVRIAAAALAAAGILWFGLSPWIALERLRGAIEARDADRLEEFLDQPALRASIKEELSAAIIRESGGDASGALVAMFGAYAVEAYAEPVLEALLTPARIIELAHGEGAWPFRRGQEAGAGSRGVEVFSSRYESFDRFAVSLRLGGGRVLDVLMRRAGLGWKVYRIRIPPQPESAARASSPGADTGERKSRDPSPEPIASPAAETDAATAPSAGTAAEARIAALRRSAEEGDVEAQRALGDVYAVGREVPQSFAEALQWYRRAAVSGDAYAQFRLGLMIREGAGTSPNDAEGTAWIRRAADKGFAPAKLALSVALTYGRGTYRNAEAAKHLLREVLGDQKAWSDKRLYATVLYNLGELEFAGDEFGSTADAAAARATWRRVSEWAGPETEVHKMAAAGIRCIDQGLSAMECAPLRCSIEGREECTEPTLPPVAQADSSLVRRVAPRLDVYRSPPTDDFYPPSAKRAEIEGVTTLRACVGPDGRTMEDPSVTRSSGNELLDEAAVRWALQARWAPGTEDGKPAEMCSQFNVRFKLTD